MERHPAILKAMRDVFQRSAAAAAVAVVTAVLLVILLAASAPAAPTGADGGHAEPRSASDDPGPTAAPTVKARSGILIRRDTGEVLWKKSAATKLPPASCTKIMTALLVLERYRDLSRYVRAPKSVTAQQKVAVGLRPGDRITVRQALKALLVQSANDAAVTLAVAVDGSEARFVRRMNKRAARLGLTETRFRNCRGKDASGHRMSARDLAKLGRYTWRKFPVFRTIVGKKTVVVTWPPSHRVKVTSRNRLLDYEWGDGIKTGSTDRAGRVLVGSGAPSGVPLIVVTMREPTRDQEEKDAVALLRWGAALTAARQ